MCELRAECLESDKYVCDPAALNRACVTLGTLAHRVAALYESALVAILL